MTSKSVEKNTLIIPTENSAKRSPLKSHPHITEPQILVKDPQLPPLKSFLRRDTGHSQESEHLSFCVDSGDKQSDKAFVTEPFPAKSGPNYLDTFALRFQNMKRTLIDDASPHNLININAYENDFSDSLNANQSVGNRPLKTFSRLGSLGDDTNFLGIERTNAQNFSNGLTIAPNAISQNNTNNYFTLSPHGLSESKYLASKENSFAKVDTWGESKSFKNCALEFNQDPIPGFDCLENQNKNSQNLVKLQNLYDMLVKIFCVNEINVFDYELSDIDEAVLNSILMRKFFKKLRRDQLSLNKLDKVEILNQIIISRSAKRPEEFYKFVLTRIIKTLKKRFKEEVKETKDLDSEFYNYYFHDVAIKESIEIENFYYPLTGKACKKKSDGTKANMNLNINYYQRIFKSQNFLSDINICLDGMKDEYCKEIEKKFESLFERWDKELQDPKLDKKAFENKVTSYLEKNKRCKLPWTIGEVGEAIERFRLLLEQCTELGHCS